MSFIVRCRAASTVEGQSYRSSLWNLSLLIVLTLSLLPLTGCRRQPEVGIIVLYRIDKPSTFIDMAEKEIERLLGSKRFNIKFVDASESPVVFTDRSVEIEKAAEFVKIPNLIGVIGHDDSRSSLLAAPIYNQAEVVQIVPMGTSRKLKEAGLWTLMLAPDDRAEGRFLGLFVAENLKAQSATIFFEDDEYGTGLKDGVVETLNQQNVRILDQIAFHALHGLSKQEAKDKYAGIVRASLEKGRPDVVIIAGRTREAGQIARLFNLRAPGVPFVAGDGVEAGIDLSQNAEQATDYFYIATFWVPDLADEKSIEFVKRFQASAGRKPLTREAMKYDAAVLLATAAVECGLERKSILAYLRELGVSRPAYRGVTGEITFLPDRQVRMIMTRVEGRRAIPVDEK